MEREVLFSIGEFSRMTGMTVKALRFYHEEGVLVPARVDGGTGYRFYAGGQVETARVVGMLRELEFPVKEIREVLAREGEGEDVVEALERQRLVLEERIKTQKKAVRVLREFIAAERQGFVMATDSVVQETKVGALLVAGIRTRGKYSDCGRLFGKLCRHARRDVGGPPMMLHYDMEYKESDADFEACVPLKRARAMAGAEVRELPAARCLTLTHTGPYEELGGAYGKLMQYAKERGYRLVAPCRERYIKGPGMIFRGNPRKYVTEIQMPFEEGT